MSAPQRTGLVCPSCRQPVAIIERETDTAITFRCEACGHQRSAPNCLRFDPGELDEHRRFMDNNFDRFTPDTSQASTERRSAELRPHPEGERDCRIVVEVNAHGGNSAGHATNEDPRARTSGRDRNMVDLAVRSHPRQPCYCPRCKGLLTWPGSARAPRYHSDQHK